jgi:FeS assembly SUF system protein
MRLENHQVTSGDYKKAKDLRQRSSKYEKLLWQALRESAASKHFKFRRQQPIHSYIADFACMDAKLLIELDGASHNARQTYDQQRDAYLKQRGYTILRFSNDELADNLGGVVAMILDRTENLLSKNESFLPASLPLPQPNPFGHQVPSDSIPQGEGSSSACQRLFDNIVACIRTVYDPEVPVNIYDLGLIYRIGLLPAEGEQFNATIDMTLTTPNCPVADRMPDMVHQAVSDLPEIHEVAVTLVWDPPWDKSRMTDEARLALNLF